MSPDEADIQLKCTHATICSTISVVQLNRSVLQGFVKYEMPFSSTFHLCLVLQHLSINVAMRIHTILASLVATCTAINITSRILAAAAADHINLYSIPAASDALASIEAIYKMDNVTVPPGISSGNKLDVHAHIIPPFYRILVPTVGGVQVPAWTLEAHLDFMAGVGIKHAVVSIGAPGSVVFPGSQAKAAALARLLNEFLAAV